MSNIYCNTVASYLTDLSATNAICQALGTTLKYSTNLFVGFQPSVDRNTITLVPTGGTSPENDKLRQNPSFQIMLKINSREKSLTVSQALINTLHGNMLNGVGHGRISANQSAPFVIGILEGGEWIVSTINFNAKHVRV